MKDEITFMQGLKDGWIVQAFLATILVIALIYATLWMENVSNELVQATMLIVGYYFGARSIAEKASLSSSAAGAGASKPQENGQGAEKPSTAQSIIDKGKRALPPEIVDMFRAARRGAATD